MKTIYLRPVFHQSEESNHSSYEAKHGGTIYCGGASFSEALTRCLEGQKLNREDVRVESLNHWDPWPN